MNASRDFGVSPGGASVYRVVRGLITDHSFQRGKGIPPMNPNKALWEKGDFTRIAKSMRESGEALVMSLGITKGLKVRDLVVSIFGAMFAPKPLMSPRRWCA
jgi:hypothetical protein